MKTTVMTISEYKQYMNKEVTLRQIKRNHANRKTATIIALAIVLVLSGIAVNVLNSTDIYAYVVDTDTTAIQAFFIDGSSII